MFTPFSFYLTLLFYVSLYSFFSSFWACVVYGVTLCLLFVVTPTLLPFTRKKKRLYDRVTSAVSVSCLFQASTDSH